MMETAEQEFEFVAKQLTTKELIEIDRRLVAGEIDGGSYIGDGCGCFYGTILMLRGDEVTEETDYSEFISYRNSLIEGSGIAANEDTGATPLEWRIYSLRQGRTPKEDFRASWLHGLLTAEIARRQS